MRRRGDQPQTTRSVRVLYAMRQLVNACGDGSTSMDRSIPTSSKQLLGQKGAELAAGSPRAQGIAMHLYAPTPSVFGWLMDATAPLLRVTRAEPTSASLT
jgi:hypothetical protein